MVWVLVDAVETELEVRDKAALRRLCSNSARVNVEYQVPLFIEQDRSEDLKRLTEFTNVLMKDALEIPKGLTDILPGLDNPPYPGPKGEEIFKTVSKKAWEEWLKHQTMLINEGQLSLTDKSSRKWLTEQMDLFLSNKDYEKPVQKLKEDKNKKSLIEKIKTKIF